MIGGGEFGSFLDKNKYDQDLVVRSAQCHTLRPMMQFSVAPWRILDPDHLAAVKQAVALSKRFTGQIMILARQAAKMGEPIMRHMDYEFPSQSFAGVTDQFMAGHGLLVAPLVEKGKTSRTVQIPPGTWRADDGKLIKRPTRINVDVPLNRLPYFEMINP